MMQNAAQQLMPLLPFCLANKSIWHPIRVTNGSSSSLLLWQCRTVPWKHLRWEKITWVTLLDYRAPASYWHSPWRLPGKVSLNTVGIHPLTVRKGVPAGRHRRGCNPRPHKAFLKKHLCDPKLTYFLLPPSYLRKHNHPKCAVCQISGVGIRIQDPSNSWQCSAGCGGGSKINLFARKNKGF